MNRISAASTAQGGRDRDPPPDARDRRAERDPRQCGQPAQRIISGERAERHRDRQHRRDLGDGGGEGPGQRPPAGHDQQHGHRHHGDHGNRVTVGVPVPVQRVPAGPEQARHPPHGEQRQQDRHEHGQRADHDQAGPPPRPAAGRADGRRVTRPVEPDRGDEAGQARRQQRGVPGGRVVRPEQPAEPRHHHGAHQAGPERQRHHDRAPGGRGRGTAPGRRPARPTIARMYAGGRQQRDDVRDADRVPDVEDPTR